MVVINVKEMTKNMWLELEGELKTVPIEGGGKTLVLYATRAQAYHPPVDEYVYFS